jgi:putative inorganic carbon (HCO3(-)) transporter
LSSSSPALAWKNHRRLWLLGQETGASVFSGAAQPFCQILVQPSLVFVAVLTIFLFRPPDVELHHLDRIAFGVIVFLVLLRAFLLRQTLPWISSISWPMAGLCVLSLYAPLMQPFDAQTWSLLAAKFLVPFALFHLACLVFTDERSRRHFEIFCLVVLAYLVFVSVASLLGANYLIYPKYILDEGLGIHADRARGPFLQAVANGVTLNLLGLMALDCWRRGRLRGPLTILLAAVPAAILATLTRAVWLSFAASILALLVVTRSVRVRRACAGLIVAGTLGLIFALSMAGCRVMLEDRLQERSPVEFRASIYEVGWEMAMERPWLGWGQNQMPAEIAKRMSDYRPDTYCAHNTYLEILVEQGLVGLTLYLWLMFGLFRLARKGGGESGGSEMDSDTRRLWLVLLGVYFLNASFVVLNYQFVNALLFTMAGIFAARQTSVPRSLDAVSG